MLQQIAELIIQYISYVPTLCIIQMQPAIVAGKVNARECTKNNDITRRRITIANKYVIIIYVLLIFLTEAAWTDCAADYIT